MKYYLAPMEGLTTYHFRRVYHKYYGGVEKYFTPFLAARNLSARERADILPEHNEGMKVVPQILANRAEVFLSIAGEAAAYGYSSVNLNLGCPSGTVTARGRGAGFLKFPEQLERFLDEIFDKCPLNISVKTRIGVDNVEEICHIANGIMIARGDLGVEIPGMEVPAIQKYLINKCRMMGTRVITATEMLESMIHNPRPTRAELSDVANAVYDGSSAIMLSGESAAGKYPVDAVRNMAQIAEYTEKQINYDKRFRDAEFVIHNVLDAVSHSTCAMAIDVQAKCIVVSSLSGRTVRMISRFRCPVDIIGMTTSEKAWRKLNLSWGVKPLLCEEFSSMEVMFYNAVKRAQEVFCLEKGDRVVLTGGLINGKTGNTNVIKVESV